MYYIYLVFYPCVETQDRYEICCDRKHETCSALYYSKTDRIYLIYKTKVNWPCINFCNLQLTATLNQAQAWFLIITFIAGMCVYALGP